MSNEVRVPELGESVVNAVIAAWLKHEGDAVNEGDALVELETDKVNVEVSADQSGILQKIMKHEGEEVVVGDVLALVAAVGDSAGQVSPEQNQAVAERQPAPQPVAAASAATEGKAPVSPLARRVAEDLNIDLAQVKGNSAHGRVTRNDVMSYAEKAAQPAAQAEAATDSLATGISAQANAAPAL